MAKKSSKHWVSTVTGVFSGIFDALVEHPNREMHELKKRALHLVMVYGLFSMGIFFMLVGMIKFLAEIYLFPSEGIGYLVFGSIIIVVLAAYSLIKEI